MTSDHLELRALLMWPTVRRAPGVPRIVVGRINNPLRHRGVSIPWLKYAVDVILDQPDAVGFVPEVLSNAG